MFSSNQSNVAALAENFIEEVFSTYLYTGTGATQTITNNIDTTTYGGLTWIKGRSGATGHRLTDTARGVTKSLESNSTAAEATESTGLTAFGTTGFTIGADADYNISEATYVSWTFREQPKFFDVVTYTGTGSNTTIAHSLGAVPGSIIVKRTDTTAAWAVYHRSLANTQYLVLNTNAAAATGATWWNSTTPTSSVFSVGTDASVNASGGTYVAYLFAHDAGGFGLTGTDNVISCGSFTTDGSGVATVSLGYEPQWVLAKKYSATGSWFLVDTMRGWINDAASGASGQDKYLLPNSSNAESNYQIGEPNATGFRIVEDASSDYIYIACRRGPMAVPTVGTSVFSTAISSADTGVITSGFVTDMAFTFDRTASGVAPYNRAILDRLRGNFRNSSTATTVAEVNNTSTVSFQQNNGIYLNGGGVYANGYVYEQFQRAPGFMDVVCYTGDGGYSSYSHNLKAVPELMIVKARSTTSNWSVYISALGFENYVRLNTTAASAGPGDFWYQTPTSTQFSVGGYTEINDTGVTYVNYLFATCAGVSKVGSYTGNGTTQAIACGFTGGARFVLIKRTDSTGDWYVYDTARGMTVLTDPYLLLNSTAAETATLGSVTTTTGGFTVNASILAAINTNAASYIFLAIA